MKPPQRGVFPEGAFSISRYLDFDREGNIVVGLVTGNPDRTQRSDRLKPQFSSRVWRTIAFDKRGNILATNDVPTSSWHENSVLAAGDGNLLIRTSNRVKLLSSKGKLIAERSLPLTDASGYTRSWWILPSPNRRWFLLHETVTPKPADEVLDAKDMATVSRCSENQQIASVADHFVLSSTSVPSPFGKIQRALRLGVKEFCGRLEFSFDFQISDSNPFYASLLDDNTVVLAGPAPTVLLYKTGQKQWHDSFDMKHDSVDARVRGDESGSVFAVLVRTWTGGSKFFDINPHLKGIKVVVYAAKDGKRLLEVPVRPLPSSVLDFAISMDGKHLGIIHDGRLLFVPIPTS